MINILDKKDCCGCGACAQRCPKQCISLAEDSEGFLYPNVDTTICVDCGLCEKVCPVLNPKEVMRPIDLHVYQNPDRDVLYNSSSGGAFSAIAQKVIDRHGIVFGAKYNKHWCVCHGAAQTQEELDAFRGSKYVQSYIGNAFIEAEQFLKEGRLVLFTGTPCQVAAFKLFLRKEYDNLLTLDFVCHGVPSPMIWRDYLAYLNPEKKNITHINLRDKKRGWSRYSYLIEAGDSSLYDDYAANSLYLRGFIDHLYIRPSCYDCPAKEGKSHSDITLADCWGIDKVHPELNNDIGLSAVKLNTLKATEFCNDIIKHDYMLPYNVFETSNPSFTKCPEITKWRSLFWRLYPEQSFNAINIINKKKKPSILERLLIKIKHTISR